MILRGAEPYENKTELCSLVHTLHFSRFGKPFKSYPNWLKKVRSEKAEVHPCLIAMVTTWMKIYETFHGGRIAYVIFNSDRFNYSSTLRVELMRQNVSSSDIMVYTPLPRYLKNLTRLHGDSMQRVKWRSALVLDHIDAMNLARQEYPHAEYICRLEDDIILDKQAVIYIHKWLHKCTPLCSLESTKRGVYAGSGALGIVVRTAHLTRLLQYLGKHYWADPLDWLLLYYAEQYGDVWTPTQPLRIVTHAPAHKSTMMHN